MSMRYFKVNVNGVAYDVAIEEVTASEMGANGSEAEGATNDGAGKIAADVNAQRSAVGATLAAQNTTAANVTSANATSANATAGDVEVTAPIRATVVNIVRSVGDKVKRGERVCVLEAMKMEYDVVSPCDGEITSINVNRGAVAEEGETVFTVRE